MPKGKAKQKSRRTNATKVTPDTGTFTKAKHQPKFVDVAGAAELLNVSERWIRRQVYEQRIPYHKFNRRLRFKVDDLVAYAEMNRKNVRYWSFAIESQRQQDGLAV